MYNKIWGIAVVLITSFSYVQNIENQINRATNKQKIMSNAAILHEANEFVKQVK